MTNNNEELLDKIRKSSPTLVGDEASKAFSSLFSKTNWVWFSSNSIPFAAVYFLVDRFVYGLAGMTIEDKFVPTSSPLQILRSHHTATSHQSDSDDIVLTALVYQNGAVILIDNSFLKEQVLLLLLDEQLCKENGIHYDKIDLTDTKAVTDES